jgi:hypothetical protein
MIALEGVHRNAAARLPRITLKNGRGPLRNSGILSVSVVYRPRFLGHRIEGYAACFTV